MNRSLVRRACDAAHTLRIDSAGRFRFDRRMRFLLLCGALLAMPLTVRAAAAPHAIESVLKTFRTDVPRGWAFTQTTTGDGQTRVERFDPKHPEISRWTLVSQNGRAPTPDELRDYREKVTRRSSNSNAPHLAEQLDLTTLAIVHETPEHITYRCRLKPSEAGDSTAKFLIATLILHQPTQTIESIELASTEPFSPTLAVKIAEMKTTLSYSLPEGDRPSLLQQSVTRLRGRAFFFKSLDADMTVTFTDHQRVAPAKR